jgi:hypothetical protein
MVLLLMFLSPPLRGVGLMALMLGHEWQHLYIYAAAAAIVLYVAAVYLSKDLLYRVGGDDIDGIDIQEAQGQLMYGNGAIEDMTCNLR